MSTHRISDAEWKVMNVIWSGDEINAREIVDQMKELEGWNKNTTYTLLNRLIQKGMVERREPAFQCIALVARDEVSFSETRSIINRMYNGSLKMLVSNFLSKEKLSKEEIEELKNIIDDSSDNK